MIDIDKAKKTFMEYIKNYNPDDPKIKLKIDHMLRVTEVAGRIAKDLKLSEEDIQLAKLIGLLHDIGRFEQIKQYNTFLDKISINHGEFGVKVLFEDNLIRKFIEDSSYDEIIRLAILNHNRPHIQKDLNERQMLHAKIIRDADKVDIYYYSTTEDIRVTYNTDKLEKDLFTPEIIEDFLQYQAIDYKKIKTHADVVISNLYYIYDLNFDISKKMIKEKKYIDILYNKIHFENEETQKQFDMVYTKVINDLNNM